MDQQQPTRQMTLPLAESEQREPLAPQVHERCLELVAQMLLELANTPTQKTLVGKGTLKNSQGDDDER